MKKWMIVLIVIVFLGVSCILAYHYLVEMQIKDKGGMENPDFTGDSEDEQIIELDGNNSYVDNEALLNRICGEWISEDGHYCLSLDSDCGIMITMDGESVLEGSVSFTYLQPGTDRETELTLDSLCLEHKDGTVIGDIVRFYHNPNSGDDELCMEMEGGERESIVFHKSKAV